MAVGQILNPHQLLFRYSFDSSPVDEGSLTRGIPAIYGSPTSTNGKIGNGLRFNANGAQTDLIAIGQYGLTAPLSVTAWVSVDSTAFSNPNYRMKVLSNKWQYDDPQGLEIQFTPYTQQWQIITPCPNRGNCPDLAKLAYTLTTNYTADTFHHVAVVVSQTTVSLYLDGVAALDNVAYSVPLTVLVTPQTSNRQGQVTGQNGHQTTIGGSLNVTNFNQGGEWHGVLDEVRLYNYTLSSEDVSAIYAQTNLAPTSQSSNAGVQPYSGFTCPASKSSYTKNLVLYNDLLPKDSNGNQLRQYPVNFVTLHRLRNVTDPPHEFANPAYDINNNNFTTVTVKNLGSSSISVTGITVANSSAFLLTGLPNFPASIAAGSTIQFGVTFIGSIGINIKSALRSLMTIATSDASQSLTVQCVGLYMDQPEGSNEVNLQTILNAFGYSINTNLGYEQVVNFQNSNILQDSVPAQYFKRADSSQPVTVQQLAAFGGLGQNPTDNTVHLFGIYNERDSSIICQQQVVQVYIQTIIPKCYFASTGAIGNCYTTCTPTQPRFYFGMDTTRFSVDSLTAGDDDGQGPKFLNNQVSWMFFPVRLADGSVVANSYIATQDYSLPKGCGDSSVTPGVANCDYNDNIWIVSNVQPADDVSGRTTSQTLPISDSFTSTVDGNLADSNGNGLQLPGRFANIYDTHVSFNSYNAANLGLNFGNGVLTVATAAGTPQAKTLVNGLKYNIDPQSTAFYVQVTVDPTTIGSNAYAGVMLGSDLYNYAALYINGQTVTFTAETQSGRQAFGEVFPTFTNTTLSPVTVTPPFSGPILNVTLILAVDPVNGTVTPYVASNGQSGAIASPYVIPGIASGYGVGPSGRLTGYGVGAGPVAWNAAGAASQNVKFYNFAAANCGGTIINTGTGSNGNTGTGSNNNSGTGTNNGATGTNTTNGGTNTNNGNGATGAATTTAVAALVLAFALFMM